MKNKNELKELRMLVDTLYLNQLRYEKELKIMRNALEDFRFQESIKQNKSEFEVMNLE
tara:strand:+ start:2772 stop:2945 length:174 start_codon:yes stop_codon:yes gene_type:complete